MEWISINDQLPEEDQLVYYYFGFFNKVYAGNYKKYRDEYYPEGVYSDCFYGESGFLTDDVTFWMPREELPEGVFFTPAVPSDDLKAKDKYWAYEALHPEEYVRVTI